MKRYVVILMIALTSLATLWPTQQSHAVIWEVVRQALIQAILAIDAQVQRLQNKTIGLQNVQKAIENALSKLKLEEISEWGEKQRKLYDDYYQELWKVKNAISTYKKVKHILDGQSQLVKAYKRAYQLFQQDDHFTREELVYIGKVYNGMLGKSLQSVDQLLLVINAFAVQMSDAERMHLIDQAATDLDHLLADLRRFNQENVRLSLQRCRQTQDADRIRQLYGINQ